jgi:hypothetical protein
VVSIGHSHVQRDVLRVLFERATGKWTDASVTRPKIAELLGYPIAAAMLQIHLDDLIHQQLVQRPQRGVRERFQITAMGIQHFDAIANDVEDGGIQSQSWTGNLDRYEINDAKAIKVAHRIRGLRSVLEQSDLSNEERSQADALITAAIALSEAPDPPWTVVKEILLLLAGLSTIFVGAIEIVKLIS